MSIHQTLFATYSNPMIVVDSADFDGTNDYMTRGAGLTGAADSKLGIFSAWLRLDGGNGSAMGLFRSATTLAGVTPRFYVDRNAATNQVGVLGANAAGTTILSLVTNGSGFLSGATWYHILGSWNLATAGARSLYTNDVSAFNAPVFTDDTIDYTVADWAVGALPDGSAKVNGCLAEIYFAPGQYLDFSLVVNRRKFISASGKPVHLGITGALPTGTAPLLYFHLDDAEAVANFATDRSGNANTMTITGTLDTGSDSPSG